MTGKIIYYLKYVFVFASVLLVFSVITKIAIGAELSIIGFIAPTLYGSTAGIIFAAYNYHLRKSEIILHETIHTSGCALVILDSDKKIVSCNKKFCDLLNCEEKVNVGEPFDKLAHLEPVHDSKIENLNKLITKGNSTVYIKIVKSSFSVPYDKKQYSVFSLLDYTATVNLEKLLIFEKENAERMEKLKSEFFAQMSHEIRTPLNTILSFHRLLRDEFGDEPPDYIKEIFGSIDNSAERIIRTIDLILNMSEIQNGFYKYKPVKIDLVTLLKELIGNFKSMADSKNISLLFHNFSVNPIIIADEYSVIQTIMNLVDNAIKFTYIGKVDIFLEDSPDNNCVIRITDTGVGMSEEYLQNLFTPFMQEERGYTRRFEGNGLGLSLVKNYCDMNKAKLRFSSKKNDGTEVFVEFPTTVRIYPGK